MMLTTATTETQETIPAGVTAARFLDALAARNFEALETIFAPDVWLRVLLPREIHEASNAKDAIATFRHWYGGASDLESVATGHHEMAGREFVLYRFLLRPEWSPGRWHVIEQTGFCRVREQRISRLDLVCSGFFPIESPNEAWPTTGGGSPELLMTHPKAHNGGSANNSQPNGDRT